MYKGDLVRVPLRLMETAKVNPYGVLYLYGWRRTTWEEKQIWYKSDEAKGMTNDGETKLAPQDVSITLDLDRIYVVVKARTRAPRGYGVAAGCMTLLDTVTGVTFFSYRSNFQNVA